jgi:hypothetical protein
MLREAERNALRGPRSGSARAPARPSAHDLHSSNLTGDKADFYAVRVSRRTGQDVGNDPFRQLS